MFVAEKVLLLLVISLAADDSLRRPILKLDSSWTKRTERSNYLSVNTIEMEQNTRNLSPERWKVYQNITIVII